MEQSTKDAATKDAATESRVEGSASGTGQRTITKYAVMKVAPLLLKGEEFALSMEQR